MAEAFNVPVIPTLDTPSTIIQGGCRVLVYSTTSYSGISYYVASDVPGAIAAVRAVVNQYGTLDANLHIASFRPGSFRVAAFYSNGSYMDSKSKQAYNTSTTGLKPYGYRETLGGMSVTNVSYPFGAFTSADAAVAAIVEKQNQNSIKYRLTNCSATNAPQYASPGQTVAVHLTIASGFQIMSPDDVYVENNGEKIPSSFVNNTITFVMP